MTEEPILPITEEQPALFPTGHGPVRRHLLPALRRWLPLLIAVFLLTCIWYLLAVTPEKTDEEPAPRSIPTRITTDWLELPQVWNLRELPPREALRNWVTVNGLWGGYNTADPLLAGAESSAWIRRHYVSGTQMVKDFHKYGLLAVGTIPGSAVMPAVLEANPGLWNSVCVSLYGETPYFNPAEQARFMCVNNPSWIRWQIALGRQAIDAGADLILVKDVMGNSLALNPAFGYPGFCPECQDAFRRDLTSRFTTDELIDQFGVDEPAWLDIAARFRDTGYDPNISLEERINRDPLVGEFIDFQVRANRKSKLELFSALRRYASEQKKRVRLAGSLQYLDAYTVNGYWIQGLPMASAMDLLVFENTYTTTIRKPATNLLPPRGKWAPWYALARELVPGPSISVLAPTVLQEYRSQAFEQGRQLANALYLLSAEALAFRCSLAMDLESDSGPSRQLWTKARRLGRFAREHQNLYHDDLIPEASLGVLYLYDKHTGSHAGSYFGLAQILYETGLPFRVIFSGTGDPLSDTLSPDRLAGFRVILVPATASPNPRQEELVREYIAKGGRVVFFDPGAYQYPVRNTVQAMDKGSWVGVAPPAGRQDFASQYFIRYEENIRKNLETLLRSLEADLPELAGSDRKIGMVMYRQPGSPGLIIHLINYDYDKSRDQIHPRKNLMLVIRKPAWYKPGRDSYYVSPDYSGRKPLRVVEKGEFLELTLPELVGYAVVVL